jgi:soluble lytic murein transglycosylase-like protein
MTSWKRLTAWLLMLPGCSVCVSGWADIYAYTADDGTVSLSNVPSDGRYSLLIGDAGLAVAKAMPLCCAQAEMQRAGYDEAIEDVSRAYGLESALLHAVISVESRYNPKAVSKKGAVGLMQLMPQTAKRYGVADAFDPRQNLDGGARYLRDLLRMFNNNVSLAVAAYNAGEQAVIKHGNRIPPYSETLRYVPQVLDFYQRYRGNS